MRTVSERGQVRLGGGKYQVGVAFAGEPVALRPTATDGLLGVFYCHQRVAEIDLRVQGGAK